MKRAPIPLVLDLWALGHSASDIAEKVGFPNHRQVARIIERARSINDPRAVLHAAKNGRLIGRAGHMRAPPLAEIVPSQRALACNAGHPQTAKNVGSQGHCLECGRIRDAIRRARA